MSNDFNFEKMKAIYKRMNELIADCDCARSKLPAEIGISQNTFSKIANYGIVPRTEPVIKIADYFNVSIEYLLNMTDDMDFTPSDQNKNLYDRLEELKEEGGYKNYCDLATQAHLPRQYFNDWFKKKLYPTIDILEYLASFFDVTIDYLLGRTD